MSHICNWAGGQWLWPLHSQLSQKLRLSQQSQHLVGEDKEHNSLSSESETERKTKDKSKKKKIQFDMFANILSI